MSTFQSSSTAEFLLLPNNMSFTSGNLATNWRRFKQKLDFFFNAIAHSDFQLTDKKKVGILMTALGDAGIDIYNTFSNLSPLSTYADVIAEFDNYCNRGKNTVYERFVFSQMTQGGKSVDVFIVELESQARKCEFVPVEFDNLVRDRLVVGINSQKAREEMLGDPHLTLETAITLAKLWEWQWEC